MAGRYFLVFCCVLVFAVSYLSGVSGAKKCYLCGDVESCKKPETVECENPSGPSICTSYLDDKGQVEKKECEATDQQLDVACMGKVCSCKADLCNGNDIHDKEKKKTNSKSSKSSAGLLQNHFSPIVSIAFLGSRFIGMPK